MWIETPTCATGFILGFAPRNPYLTYVAGIWIAGYFWALVSLWIWRSFAAACLRGWK